MPVVSKDKLHSQKAKGLLAISEHRHEDALRCESIPGDAPVPVVMALLAEWRNYHDGMLFVRPCPEVPNHGADVAGFQSEAVSVAALGPHVWKVRQAILKQGIRADIAVMPYIPSDLSAVAAPRKYIIWGKGNDGVTAGTSETIVVPIQQDDSYDRFIEHGGYSRNAVEIEFVRQKGGNCYCVQIRSAGSHMDISPAPTGAVAGFVPGGKVKVKKIYVVKDLNDVGELEKIKNADTAGLLVVQPTGSMLSHAAAHCRGSKIAFMIGGDAKVGDTITEQASGWVVIGNVKANPYNPGDYKKQFMRGLNSELNFNAMKLGTFFHQFATSPLNDPRRTAFYAGKYAKWLLQVGTTAFATESRHTNQIGCYSKGWSELRSKLRAVFVHLTGKMEFQRRDILDTLKCANATLEDIRVVCDMSNAILSMNWINSDYGGKNWVECNRHAIAAFDSIDAGDFDGVIRALNLLENAVHNNGRLFNKFEESIYWLDFATTGASMSRADIAASAEIADIALLSTWGNEYKEVTESDKTWVEIANFAREHTVSIRLVSGGDNCDIKLTSEEIEISSQFNSNGEYVGKQNVSMPVNVPSSIKPASDKIQYGAVLE